MSGRTLEYTVPPEGEGKRVRAVLQGALGLSAGLVTRLKHRPGSVRINGAGARTIDLLHAGDRLSVDVGDAKESAFVPAGPRLDVAWEDEDIIIINKPAGMATHGRSDRREPTVGAMVAAYLGTSAPFHPVNRLDRGTTGLMCAAKTGYMHERLRRILHTDAFRREYLAICTGVPPEAEGEIDAPIARYNEEKRFCVREDGAPSLTRYKVLLTWEGPQPAARAARDGQDAPDPRAHGQHRLSAARRPPLRTAEPRAGPPRAALCRAHAHTPAHRRDGIRPRTPAGGYARPAAGGLRCGRIIDATGGE